MIKIVYAAFTHHVSMTTKNTTQCPKIQKQVIYMLITRFTV